MNCYKHEGTPAVSSCSVCGRGLCTVCTEYYNKPICDYCFADYKKEEAISQEKERQKEIASLKKGIRFSVIKILWFFVCATGYVVVALLYKNSKLFLLPLGLIGAPYFLFIFFKYIVYKSDNPSPSYLYVEQKDGGVTITNSSINIFTFVIGVALFFLVFYLSIILSPILCLFEVYQIYSKSKKLNKYIDKDE